MKLYAIFDKNGRHVDSVELQDNEAPPAGATEISETLYGHALRLDNGVPILVTIKNYALFDATGRHTGTVQLADTEAAPVGGIEIAANLLGTPLILVNAVPTPRPAADIEADQAALMLTASRNAALQHIDAECARAVGALKSGYPSDEILSWDQQLREALAFSADKTAATPMLSALATARGSTVDAVAQRVSNKAAAYAAASGTVIGNHQRLRAEIMAAIDMPALAAIDLTTGWPA
ncbi:hypothetical protein F6R98_10765 [Candidatus Methylospira mobilis]|uniref:DUF4376 domain-containing protein n=1 Tax=Candidatus Methylospira mobilis TaxID=1808979 RepID=A0A5Q0BHL0_9GAMM|nr:hypothetical protein [Candidatus Methylospira mobilis]QFY43039.1 hypothetical protein F6R98_10765 [Candidatus Methylospira mobilis]